MKTNDWVRGWHAKPDMIRELTGKGVVPIEYDLDNGNEIDVPHLMGQVAGAIQKVQPAREIVEEMVEEAVQMLRLGGQYLAGNKGSKL